MGRVTSYAYTDDGLTATVTRTGPGGGSYAQETDTYDPAGNLITKVTNNGATTTSYAVDAASRVASQAVDPAGLNRVTAYTYTPDDHVATKNVSQGSGPSAQSTSYTYDPMGNETSQTLSDPGAGGPAGWWTLTQSSGTTVSDTSGSGNLATASGVTWTGSGAKLTGRRRAEDHHPRPGGGHHQVVHRVRVGEPDRDHRQRRGSPDPGRRRGGRVLPPDQHRRQLLVVRPAAPGRERPAGLVLCQRPHGPDRHLDVPDRRLQRQHPYRPAVRQRRRHRPRRHQRLDHRLQRPAGDRRGEVGQPGRHRQLRRDHRQRAGLPDRPVRGPGRHPVREGPHRRRPRHRQPDHHLPGRPARPGNRANQPGRENHQLRLRRGRPAGRHHRAARRRRGRRRHPGDGAAGHHDRLQHVRRGHRDAGPERQRHHLRLRRRRAAGLARPCRPTPRPAGPARSAARPSRPTTRSARSPPRPTRSATPPITPTTSSVDRTGQTDPDGGVTTTSYDADGEALSVDRPDRRPDDRPPTTSSAGSSPRTSVERYPSAASYTTTTSYAVTPANPSGTWKSLGHHPGRGGRQLRVRRGRGDHPGHRRRRQHHQVLLRRARPADRRPSTPTAPPTP